MEIVSLQLSFLFVQFLSKNFSGSTVPKCVRFPPVLTVSRVGFNEMGTPADGVVPCDVARDSVTRVPAVRILVLPGLHPESTYVVGLAAAACSKIFTALPASPTPKITNIALLLGSAPQ
jgi:hypothetical protein